MARLRSRDGEQSFTADYESETDFAARLFEHSKSFADPRTLVIMLLSWGDAQGGARQRATNGMPILAEQLRKDAAGIRWYDFSIVGFRAMARSSIADQNSFILWHRSVFHHILQSKSDNLVSL
jgi:hypothetical protein